MTRPPVGSTGTLAELQVEPGDKYCHAVSGSKWYAAMRGERICNRSACNTHWGSYLDESEQEYTLISRANPGQPALQIKAGKYYRTRDGRKVGPMIREPDGNYMANHPDGRGTASWMRDGIRYGGGEPKADLIAEWRDDRPTHIITHEGRTFDLTALEAPFGLLPEPVQKALDAWPHGVEMMTYSGKMIEYNLPDMKGKRGAVWRAKPAPAETRVECYRGVRGVSCDYGTCIKRPDGSIDWQSWEPDA